MKTTTLFLIIFSIGFQLNAQITLEQNGKKEALPNMILQVKQLDEFVNRFNYKQDFYGKKITTQFESQFPRDKYIFLLFNKEDERMQQNNATYIQLINSFIADVTSGSGKYIAKYSTQTYAIADCKLNYKGKPVKATLVLNREVTDKYAKWVIRNIHADFLEIPENGVLNSLPPNSHEIDFTSLKKALDKKQNLSSLLPNDKPYDAVSTFMFLTAKGELKFQYVETLKYIILDIDNWAIAVENYNRDSENSGWLISNISKVNNELKAYLGIK